MATSYRNASFRLELLLILSLILPALASVAASAAPSHFELKTIVDGELPFSKGLDTLGGGLSYGLSLTPRLYGELGFVASNDIKALLVAEARFFLAQMGPLRLALRGQATAGAGLHADVWMYRSVAGGAQADLVAGNYTLSAWGMAGLREASAWHYNELNRRFRSAGIGLTPSINRSGFVTSVSALTEELAPWQEKSWSAQVGYRLAL